MSVTFRIKASEAYRRRLDPHFHSPAFRMNRLRIESHRHLAMKGLCELSECFCGSTEFLVFRPKDDKVNPYYLQSLLHLKRFREVAAHHFTGTSGHQRVTADFFKATSIPVPPRTVQDRIASTASSIRAEARKLKADATAALDAAKRKIEKQIADGR